MSNFKYSFDELQDTSDKPNVQIEVPLEGHWLEEEYEDALYSLRYSLRHLMLVMGINAEEYEAHVNFVKVGNDTAGH